MLTAIMSFFIDWAKQIALGAILIGPAYALMLWLTGTWHELLPEKKATEVRFGYSVPSPRGEPAARSEVVSGRDEGVASPADRRRNFS